LDLALATIEQDPDIRVLVFTGSGDRAFSAGADIKEQVATADLTPEERILRQSQAGGSYILKVATLRVPTIGAINGIAWGGAALLSSVLDMRIGCEKSNFRFLAASYGQANSTWSLPLVVGLPKAKELMFTGREVHADEALQIGLLNKLVPSENLMEETMEMAGMIANSHPVMVQGIRKLLTQGIGMGLSDRYQLERDAVTSWMRSVPPREGFSEFLARKGD
jgi:enoyl-CoA hydratase